MATRINDQMHEFIINNYQGRFTRDLTELVNHKFGTDINEKYMKSYKSRFKLWSGVRTQWGNGQTNVYKPQKGFIHPNAVATQFKKGGKPRNTLPIGTEIKRDDGLIWVKLNDLPGRHDLAGRWKQRARIVWEEVYGQLIKNQIVLHLDGDSTNDNIENLAVVTRSQLAVINRNHFICEDPNITKLGIQLAEVSSILYKKRRNK